MRKRTIITAAAIAAILATVLATSPVVWAVSGAQASGAASVPQSGVAATPPIDVLAYTGGGTWVPMAALWAVLLIAAGRAAIRTSRASQGRYSR